jgi:hypothetical protein
MTLATGWVKRPHHTRGLDPLGVQSPCISIYQSLIPGITNVTDRARYYSFYPWLIWRFEQSDAERTREALVDWLRRGDVLFTMIAIRHRIVNGGGHSHLHDRGTVGNRTLTPVVDSMERDSIVDVAPYATLDDADSRYFKNKLGGLGQYYIGTLAELDLMHLDDGLPKFTSSGEELATCVDLGVAADEFVEALQTGLVTTETLDSLSGFCPCSLPDSVLEAGRLREVFLARDSVEANGRTRRASLQLHLDAVATLEELGAIDYDERTFRTMTYASACPDGSAWSPTSVIESARKGWSVYERNELLSIALQAVFGLVLEALSEADRPLNSAREVGEWFGSLDWVERAVAAVHPDAFDETAGFERACAEVEKGLPSLSDLSSAQHELNLADTLLADGVSESDRTVWLTTAIRLLLTLAVRARGAGTEYARLGFPPEFLTDHPINLEEFERRSLEEWPGMTMRAWLAGVADEWGVRSHLEVALRKLAGQRNDTFHVAPTDRGLETIHVPDPVATTPRFNQSLQILADLGYVSLQDSGAYRLTELGRGELA